MFNVNIRKETLENMEKYGYVVENQVDEIHIRNPIGKKVIEIFWSNEKKQLLIMTSKALLYVESITDIMFSKSIDSAYILVRGIETGMFFEKTLQVSDME